MNAPEPIPFKAEGPQPLVRDIPPGLSYPVEALGPLRATVETVQGMAQAPVAIPASSALAPPVRRYRRNRARRRERPRSPLL